MTPARFDELLERRLGLIKKVLKEKAKFYASTEDRLYNFKAAACMAGDSSSEEALWGMLCKHLVSVYDLVTHRRICKQEVIDGKIGDSINYLILLEALFTERLSVVQDQLIKQIQKQGLEIRDLSDLPTEKL